MPIQEDSRTSDRAPLEAMTLRAPAPTNHAAPRRMDFDTSTNTRVHELGEQMSALIAERDAVLAGVDDMWTPLGRRAPLLRAMFTGVTLPITTKYQLVEQMGGEERIVRAPALDGTGTAVCVRDFVEAIEPFLDEVLPVQDWDTLAHEILKREHRARKGKAGGRKLLARLGNRHLRRILESPEIMRKAFGASRPGKFSAEFERKRPEYELLLTPMARGRGEARSVRYLFSTIRAYPNLYAFDLVTLLELLGFLILTTDDAEAKNTVLAKSSAAITHLNNAEQNVLQASTLLDNVLGATSLTSTVTSWNQQALNKLESANQLLAQAIADIAAAEAAAAKVPGNAEAASAVAEAQARLEEIQNQIAALLTKTARAEAHKDVLAIPDVCVTIKCVEDDPCCDDNWSDVEVCVRNQSNPDVPMVCGTTGSSGSVTLCGHFGDSAVVVTTNGPGGWDETRTYNVGPTGTSRTIKVDLPGFE